MKKKFTKKYIIIYACITVFILMLMAFNYKTGNNAVSNVVGTAISPVQRLGASGVRAVKNTWENLTSSGKNARENKKLREEVLELNKQLRMLEGYKVENNRLREILDLKETRYEFDSIAANVIAKSSNEFQSTITIDKGSRDGVRKNSVVTVSEGLVGIVFETGYNYSKVKTVYDSESAVSGICLRTGDMGIVEPTRNMIAAGQCSMNYIDRSAKTVVGDIIETSGTGGLFPRGIMLGKVKEIKEDSRNLTLSAVLEPSVNINNLDTVLVSVEEVK